MPRFSGSSAHPPVKGVLHVYIPSLSTRTDGYGVRDRHRACSQPRALSRAPASSANIDLGSGPPQAGTIKADALKGVTLTFVSYGGIYQDGQMEAAVDPFAKESGAQILQDGPTDNAKIKAQVDSGNVTWDVIDSTNVFTAQHCGELVHADRHEHRRRQQDPTERKDRRMLGSRNAIRADRRLQHRKVRCQPAQELGRLLRLREVPWQEGHPGQAQGSSTRASSRALLLADGVAPDKMYPIDVDRALRKFSSIRGDIVFWNDWRQRAAVHRVRAKSTWRCCGAVAPTPL